MFKCFKCFKCGNEKKGINLGVMSISKNRGLINQLRSRPVGERQAARIQLRFARKEAADTRPSSVKGAE